MQTHLLFPYGEVGNESKGITIFDGAFRYKCYIICMERYNIQNIMRIIGNDPEHKVQRLLDYTNRPRDIADPWYTGNFDETFDDVMEGCQAFLSYLMEHLQ